VKPEKKKKKEEEEERRRRRRSGVLGKNLNLATIAW
jgi:hypothetical protein